MHFDYIVSIGGFIAFALVIWYTVSVLDILADMDETSAVRLLQDRLHVYPVLAAGFGFYMVTYAVEVYTSMTGTWRDLVMLLRLDLVGGIAAILTVFYFTYALRSAALEQYDVDSEGVRQ